MSINVRCTLYLKLLQRLQTIRNNECDHGTWPRTDPNVAFTLIRCSNKQTRNDSNRLIKHKIRNSCRQLRLNHYLQTALKPKCQICSVNP